MSESGRGALRKGRERTWRWQKLALEAGLEGCLSRHDLQGNIWCSSAIPTRFGVGRGRAFVQARVHGLMEGEGMAGALPPTVGVSL